MTSMRCYTVRAKVRLAWTEAAKFTCIWSVDGKRDDKWTSPCGEWNTKIRLSRGNKPSRLSVEVFDKRVRVQTLTLDGPETLVRERLIVGLGDSFASGEGNPDIPVKLSQEKDRNVSFRMPKRNKYKEAEYSQTSLFDLDAAQWLDRDCHRSLLGAQQRAVIAYSARHPREEVKFFGFACSGAEILQGIIGPYAGTGETSFHSRLARRAGKYNVWDASQINQVIRTICAEGETTSDIKTYFKRRALRKGDYGKRLEEIYGIDRGKKPGEARVIDGLIDRCKKFRAPIDAILLSVGGNDIGFSKIIAGALVEGPVKRSLAAFFEASITTEEANNKINQDLMGKYRELDRIFQDYLGMDDPKRIIISGYPDPLRDQDQNLCGSVGGGLRRGFEAFPKRGTAVLTLEEVKSIDLDVLQPLNKIISRAPDRLVPDGSIRKWTFAGEHIARSARHGICAEGNLSKEDTLSTNEYMDRYNAYAPTTRWFRTINDGYLVQNQMQVEEEIRASLLNVIGAPFFAEYIKLYGSIHPNSMGAAVIADAYLRELETVVAP